MKCLYDPERKAIYLVPMNASDRQIIENDLNMKSAGDFVLLVRQDVLDSDGDISHLEVSRNLYSPPRAFSSFEFELIDQVPEQPEPDPRGGRGSKRAGGPVSRQRRQAIMDFIAGLPGNRGDVVLLPPGTTPPDPSLLAKKR